MKPIAALALSLALGTTLAGLGACDKPKDRTPKTDAALPAATPAPAQPAAAGRAPISEGLPLKPEFPGFYLDVIGPAIDPLTKPARVPSGRPLNMDGFGFDPVAKAPAKGVDLVIDGKVYGTEYGHLRQDVADNQKVPGLAQVGFRTEIPAAVFTPGRHKVVVRVVAADGSGYFQSHVIDFDVEG